jgi:hypothetical protein
MTDMNEVTKSSAAADRQGVLGGRWAWQDALPPDLAPTLQGEINRRVADGYRVLSQTETTAQLVKPKTFAFGWFLLWTLLTGVGLILYPAYYLAKRDRQLYLTVDDRGTVTVASQS